MKKVGFGLVGLMVLATLYYFTLGSTQIIEEMKKEINKEIQILKVSGFTIDDREVKEKREQFTITLEDTPKVAQHLAQQNMGVTPDIEMLKGLKIGIEITYLPTAFDAIAIKMTPLNLPTNFYTLVDPIQKSSLQQLEKMIEQKVFVAHVKINRSLSDFTGHFNDIDQKILGEGNLSVLSSQGFTFKGTIEDEQIKSVTQVLKRLSYRIENELQIELLNLKSTLVTSMESNQTHVDYSIESLEFSAENREKFYLFANNIIGTSKDTLQQKLLNNQRQFEIAELNISIEKEQHIFQKIQLNTAMNNINIEAIEKFNRLSSQNLGASEQMKKMMPILKEITDSDSSIDISKFSIDTIVSQGKVYNGFKLKALGSINKAFDWNEIEKSPFALLGLFNVKANLEVSNEIMATIAQDPKAMMFMLMVQPKDNNGTKIFDVEYHQGSLKVNGKPFM